MSRSSTPSKILHPAGVAPFTQAAFDKYLSDNDGCLPPGALYQILDGPNAGIWVAPTIEGGDPVCLATKDQIPEIPAGAEGQLLTVDASGDLVWIDSDADEIPTGGTAGQYLTTDANGDLVWSDLPTSSGGLTTVATDATLTGDGTSGAPIGLPTLADLGGTAPTAPGPFVWIDDSQTPPCLMVWDCEAGGGDGAYVSFTQEGAAGGAAPLPASVAAAWDAGTFTLDAPALAGASGSFMLRGALASVDILDAMQFVTDDVNIALGAPFTAVYAADTSVPSPSGQWFFSAITPDDDADNDAATHGRKVAFGGGTTQSLGHPGGTGFFKVEPRLLRFNAGAAGVFGVAEHLHISLDEGFTWSKLL